MPRADEILEELDQHRDVIDQASDVGATESFCGAQLDPQSAGPRCTDFERKLRLKIRRGEALADRDEWRHVTRPQRHRREVVEKSNEARGVVANVLVFSCVRSARCGGKRLRKPQYRTHDVVSPSENARMVSGAPSRTP